MAKKSLFIGSFCVTHHLLNDESKNYFQQSVALSGTAQTSNIYTKGDHRCLLNTLAKRYNALIGDSMEELIEFMKRIPEEILLIFSTQIYEQSGSGENIIWWPTIEGWNEFHMKIQALILMFFDKIL